MRTRALVKDSIVPRKRKGVRRMPRYVETANPERKREHVQIAEAALGHALPRGAQVHHVDGNGQNNARGNLVICQSHRYHRLLHSRALVVKAGGNPNTDKFCADCQSAKSFGAFHARSHNKGNGRQSVCRACNRIRTLAQPRCANVPCQKWPRLPDRFCRRCGQQQRMVA